MTFPPPKAAPNAIVLEQSPTLKSFALADILSLAAGLRLKTADIHALVGFMVERPASAATTAAHGAEARGMLLEQHPFLRAIDYTPLRPVFQHGAQGLDDRLEIWYQSLERRFGNCFYILPASRWARRKNAHKL